MSTWAKISIPRNPILPIYKDGEGVGDYFVELNRCITKEIVDLWARAESLDKSQYIENAVIKTAAIDDLAVTDAKIGTLSVSKLTAGTITSQSITLALTEAAGDVCIKCGKTDFGDNTAGFILGMDDSAANVAKFEIGDASEYMKWDGSALTIRGTLNADDITGGTLAVARLSTALAYITNTAQIANAVIQTANIGLLQVTSATIADLTVGTTKITGNAVTRGAENWNVGAVTIDDDTEHELATITVTTNVNTDFVWLWASFVVTTQMLGNTKGANDTFKSIRFTIRRTNSTGTIVDQWTQPNPTVAYVSVVTGNKVVLMGTDAPGAAGSIVYKLYGRALDTNPIISTNGVVAYRMLLGLAKSK